MYLNTEWTDDGKLVITPTKELWELIRRKEFVIDDCMGLCPDTDTYTDQERIEYFLEAAVDFIAEYTDITNPAVWVERTVDARDAYKEYLEDLIADHHELTEEEYQKRKKYYEYIIQSAIEDINGFCV